MSRIFLFLDAPPTRFFAGDSMIANHKRAVVVYCLRHMQAARKDLNNGEMRESLSDESSDIYQTTSRHFFRVFSKRQRVFAGNYRTPPTYLSSKNKDIRVRVDPRVQLV